MPSDIQVFVRFDGQSVFAGENLKCTITFKNAASHSGPQTPAIPRRQHSRSASLGYFGNQDTAQKAANGQNGRPVRTQKDAVVSAASEPSHRQGSVGADSGPRSHRPGQKHQRSVSIISITSPTLSPGPPSAGIPSRPVIGHKRSSTVHLTDSQRRISQQSNVLQLTQHAGRRSPLSSTASSTPLDESRRSTPDHQFAPAQSLPSANETETRRQPSNDHVPRQAVHPSISKIRDVSHDNYEASERSSGEFYSLSNHSQETLVSEQPSILSNRPQIPSSIMRRHDSTGVTTYRKPQAANLLMGYAHLKATFTLDGSLVDQSQFEEVKEKGFLGGQAGGGVVGVQKARPTSGFFGSFNFNSIGESLNSLVANDNMSSVKEMKQITNSRAIPLLSSPQSLLFVDLHLEPGEERSFSFSTDVPRGLPSSYKGKAIRIGYNILIGVQGVPGGRGNHKVRQVAIPVRVFSGIDSDGEILGHDLFQPHVILRDVAKTKVTDPADPPQADFRRHGHKTGTSTEFLKFVENLLDRHRRRQSSSSAMDTLSGINDDTTSPTVQAINRAILLSNQLSSTSDSSSNRFDISRNGMHVAVVTIDRALHRLGETVTAVVDFANGQISCSSLHATLETIEKVSSSLAVRSAASIGRVTRRVYASHSENTLFSERTVFAPTIPASATPTFVTSGINLDWSLRFEFGTLKAIEQEDGELALKPGLSEEVVKDERGIVSIAVERLECENFEVIIPITVYGDVVPDMRDGDETVGIQI